MPMVDGMFSVVAVASGYLSKEFLEVFQNRIPLKFAGGHNRVVGRADTRHLVAAEEKRVLPLVRQRPDAPFGKAVVYRVVPVFSVQKNPVPEMIEITFRLLHQASVPRHVFRFHLVEQASHLYYDFRRFGGVPPSSYLFWTKLQFYVSILKHVELFGVHGKVAAHELVVLLLLAA